MKIQYVLMAAAVAMMTCPVFAQPQTSVEVKKETDKTTVTGMATIIATVVAIDPAKRRRHSPKWVGYCVMPGFPENHKGDKITKGIRNALARHLERKALG